MKRLLPFVALILLLLAGIFSIPFLLRPESHRAQITDLLSKHLKRPVVIGPLSMKYWPPTLRLDQVAVMQEAGRPILQMESAFAPLAWSGLFRLKIVPTSIQLSHPVLTISRKADGSWDVSDWLSGMTGSSGTPMAPLREISWKEGEVHWVDPYAGVPQELVLRTVDGSWDPKLSGVTTTGAFTGLGAPARLTLKAKGRFLSSPEWTGDIELADQSNTCTFHIEKHGAAMDVKAISPAWRLANALVFMKFYGRGAANAVDSSSPLLLQNWEMRAQGDSGHLSFDHRAGISGGLTEAKGRVDVQAAGPLAHLEFAVKDIPAEALLELAGEGISLNGKITVLAKDIELVLSTSTWSTLKGQGYVELKEGQYRLPEVPVKRLAKAKTIVYLKKKFPDLEQNGIPVTMLSAHWQAAKGMIDVSDGLVVSNGFKAAGVGKLDPMRQGFDGYIRLQFQEKDPKLAPLIPVKYRTQPAFGRLQGTWQEWSLRAYPVSKIPAAAQSKLRKAIGR